MPGRLAESCVDVPTSLMSPSSSPTKPTSHHKPSSKKTPTPKTSAGPSPPPSPPPPRTIKPSSSVMPPLDLSRLAAMNPILDRRVMFLEIASYRSSSRASSPASSTASWSSASSNSARYPPINTLEGLLRLRRQGLLPRKVYTIGDTKYNLAENDSPATVPETNLAAKAQNDTVGQPTSGKRKRLENDSTSAVSKTASREDNTDREGSPLPLPKFVLYDRSQLCQNWLKIRAPSPGLLNEGNTCFANAVLQCLFYTPQLTETLLTGAHVRSCKMRGICFLCELSKLVTYCFSPNSSKGSRRYISPHAFTSNMKAISKSFRTYEQQDAHEFLRCLIDKVQDACLVGGYEKADMYTKHTSFVHQVFGGYLRSQVYCLSCKHRSNTYDAILDLSLEISSGSSVEKCLEVFTKPELLDKDNKYKCSRCKALVAAKKQITIHDPPEVLTIHLKRFDYFSSRGAKLDKPIQYPALLDATRHCTFQDEPVVYELYGVLVHYGRSLHGGHYVSYNLSTSGQWLQYDDESVSQTKLKTVLAQKDAYLLFYRRVKTPGRKTTIPEPAVRSATNVHKGLAPHSASSNASHKEQKTAIPAISNNNKTSLPTKSVDMPKERIARPIAPMEGSRIHAKEALAMLEGGQRSAGHSGLFGARSAEVGAWDASSQATAIHRAQVLDATRHKVARPSREDTEYDAGRARKVRRKDLGQQNGHQHGHQHGHQNGHRRGQHGQHGQQRGFQGGKNNHRNHYSR